MRIVAESAGVGKGAWGRLPGGALLVAAEEVMSYQVHEDRMVIVEGPVRFKRTWWFPASGGKGGAQ